MLPISGKKIFSSRRWALVFAAGVCWTAVDVADSTPGHTNGANATSDDDMADTRAAMDVIGNM